jgi:subtilisin family serine protease
MFQARWSLDKPARPIGVSLIASSALALTITLGSAPLAVDAFAAQISPVGMSSKSRTFKATGPILKRYPSVSSSSAGSRVTPPPKGKGDGGRGPRKPPIIVKRFPVPPVIGTPPVPVVIKSGTSAGGPPSSGPGAAASPLRRPGTGGLPPANDRDYLPDEVVIQLAANGADQTARSLVQRFRLAQIESYDVPGAGTKLYRWQILGRGRTAPAVVRAIEADGSTVSVSLNYIMRLYGEAPASESAPPLDQYALAKMQLPQAHVLAQGGDVLIAIVDGGVDASHPELRGVIADTFDAVRAGNSAHPHGTAVAGAIAAHARLKGSAPAARILVAQAFDRGQDRTEGNGFTVAKSIYWATDRGARVINMSFAGMRDPSIEQSMRYARQKGVILVAAAGNKGPLSAPLFPAANPDVIAVTATDQNDKVFQAANRGKHIAVAAPGVELFLPGLNGTYQEISGTSFAAAEVSGAIALLIERKPDLTHDDARRILMLTARDLGPPGFDPHFGAGLVDAYRAVLSIAPAVAGTSAPIESASAEKN